MFVWDFCFTNEEKFFQIGHQQNFPGCISSRSRGGYWRTRHFNSLKTFFEGWVCLTAPPPPPMGGSCQPCRSNPGSASAMAWSTTLPGGHRGKRHTDFRDRVGNLPAHTDLLTWQFCVGPRVQLITKWIFCRDSFCLVTQDMSRKTACMTKQFQTFCNNKRNLWQKSPLTLMKGSLWRSRHTKLAASFTLPENAHMFEDKSVSKTVWFKPSSEWVLVDVKISDKHVCADKMWTPFLVIPKGRSKSHTTHWPRAAQWRTKKRHWLYICIYLNIPWKDMFPSGFRMRCKETNISSVWPADPDVTQEPSWILNACHTKFTSLHEN